MSEALFCPDPVFFDCARPQSKKNRGRIAKHGQRLFFLPNPVALKQEKAIRAHLEAQLWGACPHFGEDDVRVIATYHARRDWLDITVEHVRPRPKGFTGRSRDLGNVLEVVFDAMQGPVYANDNQVAEIQIVRSLD